MDPDQKFNQGGPVGPVSGIQRSSLTPTTVTRDDWIRAQALQAAAMVWSSMAGTLSIEAVTRKIVTTADRIESYIRHGIEEI